MICNPLLNIFTEPSERSSLESNGPTELPD
jgi:hypothetical protein